MDKKKFEKLVDEAVGSLPRSFRERIENVAIMVEEKPPRSSPTRASSRILLGFYQGVPLKERGSYYGNIPPDVIVIFQEPIERISFSDEEIREHVREVVLHEVGHYFGLSEADLRDIESGRKG